MTKRNPNPVEFVEELIFRAERRRDEILETLTPELLKEFRQLGATIATLRGNRAFDLGTELMIDEDVRALRKAIRSGKVEEWEATSGKTRHKRVPMAVQKDKLIKYLKKVGASYRATILAETGIPSASLTELLKGPEFDQIRRGCYGLA